MKAVVIGGSGFLGSHICDQLTESNHEVTIFDRNESSFRLDCQKIIIGDTADKELMSSIINDTDVVYHIAGLSDIDEAINKPSDTIIQNVLGTINVLDILKEHKNIKFIYASTVYVDSREGSFYRCSKEAAENYIEEYHKLYDIDYRIIRFGSLYGPRSDHRNGIWRIINKAIESGIVEYEGNIESIREYIHVIDAARASVDILTDEFKNQYITLTGKESMRVYDLLNMISEIMDIKQKVQFKEKDYLGHYIRTPYAHKERFEFKYTGNKHIDIGQGLLKLIKSLNT